MLRQAMMSNDAVTFKAWKTFEASLFARPASKANQHGEGKVPSYLRLHLDSTYFHSSSLTYTLQSSKQDITVVNSITRAPSVLAQAPVLDCCTELAIRNPL
jgi:hypothetical protein